jgi:hypothetical protein
MKSTKNEEIRNFLLISSKSDNYFTVASYFRYVKSKIGTDLPEPWQSRREGYKACGLIASSICMDRDIEVGSTSHKDFGRINTYPEKILAEVIFGNSFRDMFPNYSELLNNRFPTPRKKK